MTFDLPFKTRLPHPASPPPHPRVQIEDAPRRSASTHDDAATAALSTTPPLSDLIDSEDFLHASDEEDAEKLAKKACRE